MQKIITHSGPRAHFDEFLAISLLLAEIGSIETPVFRREPSGEEIDDGNVAVIDIGKEHNPDLLLFDHHQSGDLPSSMTLVAQFLGLEEAMRGAFDWFSFKDTLDTDGPKAAAQACGIEGDIRATQSPVESYILRTFAQQEGEVPRPLVKFMEGFGRSIIDRTREFGWKLVEAEEEGRVEDVCGETVYIREDEKPDAQVLRTLRKDLDLGFDVTITKDPRSGDLAVYRYEDAGHIDFSYASGLNGVHFAHEAGFLATVEDMATAKKVIGKC